jgi:hypothetical protein
MNSRSTTVRLWCLAFALQCLIQFASGCITLQDDQLCWPNSSYTKFGTKTTYKNARNDRIAESGFTETKLQQYFANLSCRLTQKRLFVFARHSIKYPKAESIVQMRKFQQTFVPLVHANLPLALKEKKLCGANIISFMNWHLTFQVSSAYEIMGTGYKETSRIGERRIILFARTYQINAIISLFQSHTNAALLPDFAGQSDQHPDRDHLQEAYTTDDGGVHERTRLHR